MKRFLFFLTGILIFTSVIAQPELNYDESKVPLFKLPNPLIFSGGRKVKTSTAWERKQRPAIFRLFEEQMFGRIPKNLKMNSFSLKEESRNTPYPNAIRKQVAFVIEKEGRELLVQLLMYLPDVEHRVPLFLGYNFMGNHAVTNDPKVFISESWAANIPSLGVINNRFTEQSRGAESERWDIKTILENGYGVATVYYGDVDPDRDDFTDGIHPFAYAQGQVKPALNEWGSIAAWAWGLSQVMDYLVTDRNIDAQKVVLTGHSRLGKAALWAGALDRRFAIVVSNNSGCGGAALSRRKFGETVEIINNAFPHWFCGNFKAYNKNEDNLPFDQHQLIALIAPRPVYIASAAVDKWADPRGEYLAGYFASPVYNLYGKKGLVSDEMPALNQPVMNHIGYHIRSGGHDVKPFDWEQFIKFADLHFKKEPEKK